MPKSGAQPGPFEQADPARLDEAALALLYCNDCNAGGARKSQPWDATERLHSAGPISDPAKARKSVDLYKEGFEKGHAAFERLFVAKGG